MAFQKMCPEKSNTTTTIKTYKQTENLMVRVVHLSVLALNMIIVTANLVVIGVCLHMWC